MTAAEGPAGTTRVPAGPFVHRETVRTATGAVHVAWTSVAGPFDMSANALFLVATKHGDLSLVAPLAALYPVTTVLLALAVDGERLRLLQVVGLVLALAALLLVTAH